MKDLHIKTTENITVTTKIHTYKMWFNGMKHFFTVKVSPPKK